MFLLQDFTQQPPAQELIARDLHENEWKFRHIFRGELLITCFYWKNTIHYMVVSVVNCFMPLS